MGSLTWPQAGIGGRRRGLSQAFLRYLSTRMVQSRVANQFPLVRLVVDLLECIFDLPKGHLSAISTSSSASTAYNRQY